MMDLYFHRVSPFGHLRVYAFSGSPKLFAGLHVLLRLSIPRHPPTALNSLITYDLLLAVFAYQFFANVLNTFLFSSANFHQ